MILTQQNWHTLRKTSPSAAGVESHECGMNNAGIKHYLIIPILKQLHFTEIKWYLANILMHHNTSIHISN